jgi:hypothetical protein
MKIQVCWENGIDVNKKASARAIQRIGKKGIRLLRYAFESGIRISIRAVKTDSEEKLGLPSLRAGEIVLATIRGRKTGRVLGHLHTSLALLKTDMWICTSSTTRLLPKPGRERPVEAMLERRSMDLSATSALPTQAALAPRRCRAGLYETVRSRFQSSADEVKNWRSVPGEGRRLHCMKALSGA